MNWLFLAVLGQFLAGIVAILDKFIVTDSRILPRPFVYAFYSCLMTGFWVVIFFLAYIPGLHHLGIPNFADIHKPTIQVLGMSFLAAYTFFMALVSMYEALREKDASDVLPAIGAVSAISSFALSYIFLNIPLAPHFMYGVLLLALGTFLLSHVRFNKEAKTLLRLFHSGLFFGFHYIVMKGLFLETDFANGFFWSRISFVLFSLSLLLVPVYFEKIRQQTKSTRNKARILVILTKIIAGISAFLILKATDMGDVTVVQALDGFKYVSIILLSFLFGRFIPHTAGENDFDFKTIVRKALYIAIISLGVVILFT